MSHPVWLVPLPVVVPLLAAGLTLALYRRPRAQRTISVVALSIVLAVSATLLVLTDAGPLVLDVGGWAAPVGIDLVADRLSALMLTVSSAVTLCVLLYSLAQGEADGDEAVLEGCANGPGHQASLTPRRSASGLGKVCMASARNRVTKCSSSSSRRRPLTTKSSRLWARAAFLTSSFCRSVSLR